MNCQEALDKLYHMIDQESSDIEIKTIRKHLAHCTNCSDIFKLEQTVNDFLLARIRQSDKPVSLNKLKFKILEKLDSVDCDDNEPGSENFID